MLFLLILQRIGALLGRFERSFLSPMMLFGKELNNVVQL